MDIEFQFYVWKHSNFPSMEVLQKVALLDFYGAFIT